MENKGYTLIPDRFLELDLSISEIIILSVILGFSQDGKSTFKGSVGYLSKKAKCSSRTTLRALKALVDKELIGKIERDMNGVKFCEYYDIATRHNITRCDTTSQGMTPCHEGCDTMSHNNIVDNIDIINNTHTHARAKDNFDFRQFFINLGCDPSVLDDWIAVRKKKGGVNSRTAAEGIAAEITRSGKTPTECIRKSAENSWCGFRWQWWENEINEVKLKQIQNDNQRKYDKRRGTDPPDPSTVVEWGFGDRQEK